MKTSVPYVASGSGLGQFQANPVFSRAHRPLDKFQKDLPLVKALREQRRLYW